MGLQSDATKVFKDFKRIFNKFFGNVIDKRKFKKKGKTMKKWFIQEMNK